MIIDHEYVKKTFAKYVSDYNPEDPKIALKIAHTYRVAELCEDIAKSENLNSRDCDLAWLIGMLHDVGRFEQVRRYNTFADADSIDHALLGCQILFEDNKIRDYIDDASEDEIIHVAIKNHSAYKIEQGLSEREEMFCNLLRDADKIDILRVQLDTPLEDIYNVSREEIEHSVVTKEVMDAFYEKHAVLRKLKKVAVDHIVGHISLVYELVYPRSIEIMKKQGYLERLMAFESKEEETRKQFESIRQYMNAYIEEVSK